MADGKHESLVRACLSAALLLGAAQFVVWLAALGGQDLHGALGGAAVVACLAALWAGRRDAVWPPGGVRLPAGRWPFVVLGALYFATWLAHQGLRYYRFEFANFDLGIYSNVAFNTAHGHPFHSSLLAHSHLGEHFSPVTGLFAPLYALRPSVYWLFGAQCLSFAAVPLALRVVCHGAIGDPRRAQAVALALSLLWGIYPPMAAAMRFPFHPSSLAAPWVLLAFHYTRSGCWRRAAPVLLLLLCFKESLALVWVGLGLHLLAQPAPRREGSPGRLAGILLIAGGLAAAAVMVKWVIPAFRDGDWGQASRLGPLVDLKLKAWYVAYLLAPLLGLPLLGWRHGMVALPSILLNLSTLYRPQYSAGYQYDDVIAPLLFAAAVPAFEQLWRASARVRTARRVALAGVAVYALALLHLPDSPLREALAHPPEARHHALNAELRKLDRAYPGVWMYVQSHLGPHLHRYEQRQFPIHSRDCGRERFRPGTLIVLSEAVNPWGFHNLAECIAEIEARSRFTRRTEYEWLRVYEVR